MMVRTQVQLTEEQALALKELANKQGVSVAELVRRSVDQFIRSPEVISKEERRKRALSIVGKFRSGKSDISVNHDKYLDEIYGSW